MLILRCSSSAASVHGLVEASEALGGEMLFLSPAAVRTGKELEAAFYLAERAFEGKTNVSGKMANEAMLFLACETNFASALRKVGAADADDFVLVAKKNVRIAELKKILLLTKAKKLVLPEWGKKRGSYAEGELAVERMALARIKN